MDNKALARDKQIAYSIINAWKNGDEGAMMDQAWYIMSRYRQEIEATARAEALNLAADRTIKWIDDAYGICRSMDDVASLRYVILADKQEGQ